MPRPSELSKIAVQRGISEEELLMQTLQEADGKIDKAAALLKMYPYSIRSELSKRGLRVVRDITVRLERVTAE